MNRFLQAVVIGLVSAAPGMLACGQTCPVTPPSLSSSGVPTNIVFLGTGMPDPDPKRQGPSFVVETGGNTYLFDFGVGVMRQAAAAGVNLYPPTAAFLSHLHTDHTLGLPDLMFTPWGADGTKGVLCLYGPVGLQWMVDNIRNAYTQDICVRENCQYFGTNKYKPPVVTEIAFTDHANGGPSPLPSPGVAPKCRTCDQTCPAASSCTCGTVPAFKPQTVYEDAGVKVSAFLVPHGCWDEALGYIIETKRDKKKIVYSGDTRYTPSMGKACDGCDVLIHEIWWRSGTSTCGPNSYGTCFHTNVAGVQQVFKEARPGRLVITHQVGSPDPKGLGIPECSSPSSTNCVVFAKDLQSVTP
jgi:ribonuclease BN (tRNA processing enzyme)